jgi:DNA polymerase-3 subunit beta
MMLTIEPKYLKALLVTAGKGDVRYYLNGVAFDGQAERTIWASADGHRMSLYKGQASDDGETGLGILSREYAEAVLKVAGKNKRLLFTVDVKALTIAESITGMAGKLVDGKFPDYRRVVPATCSGQVAQFNPEFVGDLVKQSKAMGCSRYASIGHNGESGALITFSDSEFFGVLMPIRGEPGLVAPDWFTEKTEETAQTEETAAA